MTATLDTYKQSEKQPGKFSTCCKSGSQTPRTETTPADSHPQSGGHTALGPLLRDQRPGEAVEWVEGRPDWGGAACCPSAGRSQEHPHGQSCTCSPGQKVSGWWGPLPSGEEGFRVGSGLSEGKENHTWDPKCPHGETQERTTAGSRGHALSPQHHHGCHGDGPPQLL